MPLCVNHSHENWFYQCGSCKCLRFAFVSGDSPRRGEDLKRDSLDPVARVNDFVGSFEKYDSPFQYDQKREQIYCCSGEDDYHLHQMDVLRCLMIHVLPCQTGRTSSTVGSCGIGLM